MSQNNLCKANSFSNLIFRLWLVICLKSGIQETVCTVPNLLYVHLLLVSCFLRNSDDYAVIIAGYDLRQLILLSSSDEESHWVPLRKPSFCAGLLSLSFCSSPWLHLWISNNKYDGWNNQGWVKLSAEAGNPYWDLDYSGYHKTKSNKY